MRPRGIPDYEVGAVQADPSLKALRFQSLIVKNYNSAFKLNLVFLRLLPLQRVGVHAGAQLRTRDGGDVDPQPGEGVVVYLLLRVHISSSFHRRLSFFLGHLYNHIRRTLVVF